MDTLDGMVAVMTEEGFIITVVLEPEVEQLAKAGETEPPKRVNVGEPAVEVQSMVKTTVPPGMDKPNLSFEPAFHTAKTLEVE